MAMESQARQINLVPAPDRRQSETALAVARGTARMLHTLGFSCISELSLPSGRRADLVALNERGEIWIVEIKSSLEDLRADQKWPEYRSHCDRLFFAFTRELSHEIFPLDTGLIVAERGVVILNGDEVTNGALTNTAGVITQSGVIEADTSITRNSQIFLDARLQLSLTGENLLHPWHQEYPAPGADRVPRQVYAALRLRF